MVKRGATDLDKKTDSSTVTAISKLSLIRVIGSSEKLLVSVQKPVKEIEAGDDLEVVKRMHE